MEFSRAQKYTCSGDMAAGASQFIPQPANNMYSAVAASLQHGFNRKQAQVGVSPSTIGPCFECGMPGHYRKYCPKLVGKQVELDDVLIIILLCWSAVLNFVILESIF